MTAVEPVRVARGPVGTMSARHGARPAALSRLRPVRLVEPSSEGDERIRPWLPQPPPGGDADAVARRPLRDAAVVPVTGVGGGGGRTTVTAALGGTLAALRGERSVAVVDATVSPAGMLAVRLGLRSPATLHDLLAGRPAEDCFGVGPGGLAVLAGDRPSAGWLLDEAALATALARLGRWCPLQLVDFPPAPGEWAWSWVRSGAPAVLFVVRAAEPDLVLLAETLLALERAGMAEPSLRSVVVVNHPVPGRAGRRARAAEQLVAARVRSMVRLPFDSRLRDGAEVRLDRLAGRTRRCLLRLAAECGARFE